MKHNTLDMLCASVSSFMSDGQHDFRIVLNVILCENWEKQVHVVISTFRLHVLNPYHCLSACGISSSLFGYMCHGPDQ